MSFYYQFPQNKRYRGRLQKEYFWRLVEYKIRNTILIALLVGALGTLVWHSKVGYNLRFMLTKGMPTRIVKLPF